MRVHSAWWLAGVALLVAGCGGGGGGTTTTTKTTPTVSAWPTAGAITYGQTLTNSTLTGGMASVAGTFAWTSPSTSPGAGTVSESVTFTPSDTTNYNTVTGSVNVTVNKATLTVTASSTSLAYGSATPTITPSYSGFVNSDSSSSLTTAPSCTTQYTPTSPVSGSPYVTNCSGGVSSNYTFSYMAGTVTVTKATPTVTTWPTASAITFGQTLASSTLTGGMASVAGTFAWTTPSTAPSAGTVSESVTFTPTDTGDYNTVTGSVNVTANQPAPQVTAVTPTNGATDVSVSSPSIMATFNQAMNTATITPSTFSVVAQGGGTVNGTVAASNGNQTFAFTPSQNLAYSTTYTATISMAATSAGGTALAANYTWSFTTAAAPAPTVSSTVPANGATSVNVGNALTATFSIPMDTSTINSSTFTLTGPGNTAVAGLVSYNSGTSTATFTPNASLAYSSSYTATITTGAKSSAEAPLASNYVWMFTTSASPNSVTVDFGIPYQTIRGFGGSTAWLGKMPQAVATALFSTTNGLGLSILRVRIDPQGSASGGGTQGLPYETSQWDAEAANGQEAVAANPNAIVFASPWTPPAAWKLNGSATHTFGSGTWNESFASCAEGTGYCGGYLDPNHYVDYANYLEDFVQFFNTTNSSNGVSLYAISMQNEPDWNTTYESCVWDPGQMDTWIANNASTITSDAYGTKFIMPESLNFNPVQAATALADSNAQGLISILGGHLYGVQPSAYTIPSGDTPKELWMTEYGPGSTATPTFSQVLTTYGESIHNSMVTGQYNAYVWWGVFGNSTGANGGGTSAGSYGLVDYAGNQTVAGWVFGQYSKFIQPGFQRVSATANPVSGVYVSAYDYTGSKNYSNKYAIVAINAGSSSQALSFTLNNGSNVTSLTPYLSTSAAGLAAQSAVTVSNGQFNYTLPAQSIVTFVQ